MMGARAAAQFSTSKPILGITIQSVEIRDVQVPGKHCRTRSPGRRRRSGSGRHASFWARRRRKSRASSRMRLWSTRATPWRCTCAAMNMLYEAVKERGSMVIVPSSAVETMGLGGSLAAVAMNGGKP